MSDWVLFALALAAGGVAGWILAAWRLEGKTGGRITAAEGLAAPLRDAVERYEREIQEMEKTRQAAYGALDQHLKTLAASNEELQRETGSLVNALRSPQVRGRWGEMTLRRVAELAGMSGHCDFKEQETLDGET